MRKKIIVFLLTINLLSFCVLVYLVVVRFPWLVTLIAVLLAVELYIAYGYYSLKHYKEKMIIDPKDDIERNFDRLIIGDATAVPSIQDKAMMIVGYHSNWKTDCEIVKRYYSFVKRGGMIDLYIDLRNKKYFVRNELDPFSYDLLHKVTLFENQINKPKILLGLILSSFEFPFLRWTRRKRHASKNTKQNAALDELQVFCEERELQINFFN